MPISCSSFRDRLDRLPLVLAGPILRYTCIESVTVWIALKEKSQVRLTVYTTRENGNAIAESIMSAEAKTVALGKNLHIIAITAFGQNLRSGQIYAYDLSFSLENKILDNLTQALTSVSLPQVPVSYFEHQLPTFSLPPEDIDRLKIIQGSCRKPHGKDGDALAILDRLIENSAEFPDDRPHQLFLTGDQIYGDDVADPLLHIATELGDCLLGWQEKLPLSGSEQYAIAKQFPPGTRSQIVETQAGLTAGLHKKAQYTKSHLLSWGEYCALYLLSWSQVFWLESLTEIKETKLDRQQGKIWHQETKQLKNLVSTLWQVRRALANIPTYTIFDDHDVSDDWNLNQAWCLQVFSKLLGRRVVQNALLAYAFFQGWGNTPEQFQTGNSGAKLAIAVERWSTSAGEDFSALDEITRYLGLPTCEPNSGLPKMNLERDVLVLDRDPEALRWHYRVTSPSHLIIVLDTRTWRGYPADGEPFTPPMLLCPSAFERQLRASLPPQKHNQDRAIFVIAPTNLFSLRAIESIQRWFLHKKQVYNADVGDSWNINDRALAELLATLFEQRDRLIILSGDIHYSSAVRLDYWLSSALESRVLVQLTSSSLKNAEFKTQLLHTKFKSSLFTEPKRFWIGWFNPYRMSEVKNLQQVTQKSADADWFCSLEWIKRQSSRLPNWKTNVLNLSVRVNRNRYFGWLLQLLPKLWQNRWFQEGKEVVGVNNLGSIQFDRLKDPETCAIIQDNYWYSSWGNKQVVFSRFRVSLRKKGVKVRD
jgi:hypothetical protein